MINNKPTVTVIAGPNGAGKTSLQSLLRQARLINCNVVNIDALTIDLDTLPEDPLRYSRELAKRTDKKFYDLCVTAIKQGNDFAFECNLRKEQVKYLYLFEEAGYELNLIYFWLNDIQISFNRVRTRVMKGGHSVGKSSIETNFAEGLKNLDESFKFWQNVYVIDNSMDTEDLHEKSNLPLICYIHHGKILYMTNDIAAEELSRNFPNITATYHKTA